MKYLSYAFIAAVYLFIQGCSTVPEGDFSFKPVVAEWLLNPQKDEIAQNGIKNISAYVTAYYKEGALYPGKEVPHHYCYFDKSGNKTSDYVFPNDNIYHDRQYLYTYNKNDIKTEQAVFILSTRIRENKIFTLDKKGNVVEEYKFAKNGKIESSSVYRYSPSGKLTEKINYEGKYDIIDKLVYEYDANGNNILIKYYNAEGVLLSKKVIKYDSSNNITEEAVYNLQNIEQFRFKYFYDEDNKVDSAIYYKSGSSPVNYEFKKDEDGYPIFITGYNSKGGIYKLYKFEYEYYYSRNSFAANTSLYPISNYEYEGSLTAGYIQSSSVIFPVKNLKTENIKAEMYWSDGGGGVKRINGRVRIIPKRKGGKEILSPVIMDYSGSMQYNDRKNVQNAMEMFINRMGSNDQLEILKFNTTLYRKSEFTSDKYTLRSAVNDQYDNNLSGGTALFDAINTGVDDLKFQNSKEFIRCVIALTDGGENSSINKDLEYVISNANNYGIPVYTIGYGIDEPDNNCRGHYDPPSKSGNYCEWVLWEIATRTGGFYFYAPKNSSDINDVYNSISGQIGNTFDIIVDFPPSEIPATGTNVTVKLTLDYRKTLKIIERSYIIK